MHDPSGVNIATGDVSIVNSTLSIKAVPTTVGTHTVLWQTVSADGHAVSGTFAFDYEGPVADAGGAPSATAAATTPAATTPAASSTPSSGAAMGTPLPLATDSAGSSDTGSGAFVWIGLASALAVIVVVAVVAVVMLRRRREPSDPE